MNFVVAATKLLVAGGAARDHNAAMKGYGQFCPVARASEIFAERWTPLILREILAERHHFNEIHQGLHRIAPSVLGQRLRHLERMGVLETRPNPSGRGSTYHLTPAGQELADVVRSLGVWGQHWLDLRREHLDPEFLMWRLYRQLLPDHLPTRRCVVRFEFDRDPKSYWLVLRRPDPDLCYADPGFGDDLVVRADLEALTRVYLGHLRLAEAQRAGLVRIEGSRELARRLPDWFPVSGFAEHARTLRYDSASQSYRGPGELAAARS